MKILKLAMVCALIFMMTGCGAAIKNAEWAQHDTLYRDSEHWKFSWYGWRSPTAEDVKNSDARQWWGKEINANNIK